MQERSQRSEQVSIIKRRSLEDMDGHIGIGGRILARLFNDKTGQVQEIEGYNLITSAGDVHYAERATTETPAVDFQMLQLSTVATPAPVKASAHGDIASFIAGSSSIVVAGYPAAGDTDPDNSGSGAAVISWRFAYAKADFNSGVTRGVITTTGGGQTNLLTYFIFAPTFTKTSDDTLVVFVNHTVLGT